MYFEQLYLACLSHASYMIGANGEAAVIDPQRDVDIYLEAAKENGLTIRHIFETHLHADFVSGHKELAARTGAAIYIGTSANAKFAHVPMTDGFELEMGQVTLRVLETPGHTPESICIVATDREKSDQPWAVFTGDTLFIGDVGRPDLSRAFTPQELASMLYESLHEKLLALPDSVLVYPAHGAGSLCGRNMRAERSSTIGTERLTNYALQIKTKEEFVRQLTTNLPARPDYFQQDAEINREGAGPLTALGPLPPLSPAEVKTFLESKANVLDVRTGDEFAAEHIPGAINIALSGQFASWAGNLLGLDANPVLIAESEAQVEEARLRLARVGVEAVRGFLKGGVAAWKNAGLPVAQTAQISARQLGARLLDGSMQVLDVRRGGEWRAGHVPDARLHALDSFPHELPSIDASVPVAVHCKSGYRSMIACSLLERAGHRNVLNVTGGFDAWHAEGLPEVTEQAVSA